MTPQPPTAIGGLDFLDDGPVPPIQRVQAVADPVTPPFPHHAGCTADYPEKVPGEAPQQITRQTLDDGYWVDTCVDCGAFVSNLPPENDPYWDEAKRDLADQLKTPQKRVSRIEVAALDDGPASDTPETTPIPEILDTDLNFLCGAAGCLAGDTLVRYRRGQRNSGRRLTMHDLFRKFNGISKARNPWRREPALPTYLHSWRDDGVVFYNRIVAVLQSGVKPLVQVEFSDGTELRATEDHPILTPHGYVQAGRLAKQQKIIAVGSMLTGPGDGRNLTDRPHRIIVNLKHHPFGAKKTVAGIYHYTRVARARLVVEAALNNLEYGRFVEILQEDDELAAALRYLPEDFDVHHRDEDTLNDTIENLVALPASAHAKLHADQSVRHLQEHTEFTREVTVKDVKQDARGEMTYDIQMESPANNFAANGVFVHNSGKTWLVRAMVAQRPGVLLCATTGIASCNLGEGTTINAALRYFDTDSLRDSYVSGHLGAILGKLYKQGIRRIDIDEISMMDADQLTILVQALEEFAGRGYTKDHHLLDEITYAMDEEGKDIHTEWPIKVTFVGDFAQLPPVKAKFAFESPEWGKVAAHTHTLRTIRRQADPDFILALRAARSGDADRVCDYFGPRLSASMDHHYDGPTILATNDAVDRFNRLRLGEVPGLLAKFPSDRWGQLRGDWKEDPDLRKAKGIPKTCDLKVGALVMILANRRKDGTEDEAAPQLLYSNGDLGVVESIHVGLKQCYVKLHRTKTTVLVDYITRLNVIPLEPGRVKELKLAGEDEKIQRDRSGKAIAEVVGGITYLPLRVAYAATVHKCQGLSFDAVQVNTREGMFKQPGLLYVALSRARTADGIRLIGTVDGLRARCTVDARVKPWL